MIAHKYKHTNIKNSNDNIKSSKRNVSYINEYENSPHI